MRVRVAVVAVVIGAGLGSGACKFDGSGPSNGDQDAPVSDAPPTIDAMEGAPDARIDAMPGAPDAKLCVPACDNGTLLACDPQDPTAPPTASPCALGCTTTGSTDAPHCAALTPSNGATSADLAGVDAQIVVADQWWFANTADGRIDSTIDQGMTFQPVRAAGAGVVDHIGFRVTADGAALWSFDSLTVGQNGYVRPFGTRPVIFLVRGAVAINGGLVDASGGCFINDAFVRQCGTLGGGMGGLAAASGTGCAAGAKPVTQSTSHSAGGGGGGFGENGAKGGDSDAQRAGGAGGDASACPATLSPLVGGAGGGGAGTGVAIASAAAGGAGGGAIQITSYTSIAITATASTGGVIAASGIGGSGSGGGGGGGGGSGGGILLESPLISIMQSYVVANGGGGGSGTVATANGEAGKASTVAATGGGTGNSAGGAGGTGTTDPRPGQGGNIDGAGGGGGGAGTIRLHVPAAGLTNTAGVISPPSVRDDLTLQ